VTTASSHGAVVLAAGGSTRLGRPKQLLELDGEPLVRRAARRASEAGFDPVVVVVGAEGEAVARALGEAFVAVRNPRWSTGAASSIRRGVEALCAARPDVDGALLVTCDQPLVEARHLVALRAALGPDQLIAASRYAGTLGVPALFSRAVFGELFALTGESGAKRVVMRDLRRVAEVELPEAGRDVDTEADWRALTVPG
jgi:molybdenum cofactor cytidylyltransferase